MRTIKVSKVISLFMALFLLFSIFQAPVNARTYCSITVQDEEDGSAITNSTFIIRDSGGRTLTFNYSNGYYVFSEAASIQELKTNVAGKILIEALPNGQYTAIQKTLPDKYNSDLKTKSFNTNNNSDIIITNGKKYGAIALKVVDADNTSHQISNIGFSIKDSAGSFVKFAKTNSSYTYTTNSSNSATTKLYSNSGRIDIYKLPVGKYTVIQNNTHSKYNIAKPISVKVDNTRNTQKIITIKNTQQTGKISVSNSVSGNATYNLLSGDRALKFLKSSDGNYSYSVNGSVTALKTFNGKLNLSGIPEGSYILKVDSAPSGYSVNNYTKTVNVSINKTSNVTFSFTKKSSSQPISNDGKIHVIDENNNNLPGVNIAITNANGGTVKTVKTDSSGNISLSDLSEGKYNFKVSSVPDGYALDVSANYSFSINKDGSVSDVPIVTVKNIAIYIQHTDKVKGIEFTLYNDYKEKVDTAKTNDDGLAVFKKLIPGTYTIKQTSAPEGYTVFSTIKTVIVTNSFNNSNSPINFNNSGDTEVIEGTTVPTTEPIETIPMLTLPGETEPEAIVTAPQPETEPVSKPIPAKKSNSVIWLWIILAVVGGAAIGATVAVIVNKRKAKKENDDALLTENDSENEVSMEPEQPQEVSIPQNEEVSEDGLDIDGPETSSEEAIEEHVGLLDNSTNEINDNVEENKIHTQIDSVYGTDVGEYEDTTIAVQEEPILPIDEENSDVGEIKNTKIVNNDEPNEIEKTIDKLYGGDAGELQENNTSDLVAQEGFSFDTAKEDVGILTTTKTVDPNMEAKEEEKSIDAIYGNDVGELVSSSPKPKQEKHQYSPSKKKNRKKRKK